MAGQAGCPQRRRGTNEKGERQLRFTGDFCVELSGTGGGKVQFWLAGKNHTAAVRKWDLHDSRNANRGNAPVADKQI